MPQTRTRLHPFEQMSPLEWKSSYDWNGWCSEVFENYPAIRSPNLAAETTVPALLLGMDLSFIYSLYEFSRTLIEK
jgi:hypothetical protein